MQNRVIAKDGNYTVRSEHCCKLPFYFIRIEGTQDFRVMHNKAKVGHHPWYSARAHVLREALDILVKDQIVTEAEAEVAIKRIRECLRVCSSN